MITGNVRFELSVTLKCNSDKEAEEAVEALIEKIRLENYSKIKVVSCGLTDGPWWESK